MEKNNLENRIKELELEVSNLKSSEKFYRSLFENMLNGFAYCQMHFDEKDKPLDFTYISVNKAFESQTGLINVVGRKVTELIPNIRDYDMELLEIYGQVSKTGKQKHFEMLINSMMKWFSISAYCPKQGYFVTIFEDITDQKKAEEELIIQKHFFEQMFIQSSISTQILDSDGWCERINPKLSEIFGVKPQNIEGKVYNIFKDEAIRQGGVIPYLESVFYEGKTAEWEVFFDIGVAADSQDIEVKEKKKEWYYNWSYPIFDKNGVIRNVIIQHTNITERKKAEIELIRAKEKAEESDRLKSAFLSNMSHEIRTPMNGILGFADILKEPDLTIGEQQEYIKIIEESGKRMLNTINDIIDISKIESGLTKVEMKETNINEKIDFVYKFFKPAVDRKGIQLFVKTGLQSKEAIIKTDVEKINIILTNLVNNAIKFTYEGSIEFGYEKKGEFLEFFVKDTGIGIPQNHQQIIFERFRQGSESHNRGYEGSGLGLSISKSYVEMLDGEIWVESEERKGSIFYFTIPYNVVSPEKNTFKNADSDMSEDLKIKKMKILVVEDDEVSNYLITKTLREISYEILYAKTGVEAVVTCRNNSNIDLILMDIKMPDMDGWEATLQIRQFNTDVIIIAQTAFAFSDDREKAIKAGCNDYISKPVNRTLLYKLIKKHIKKIENEY